MTVAWSPDGTLLVSGGGGREGGELVVWDAERGTYLRTLRGHSAIVHAVAWGPGQELLVSGSSDGQLRWWNMQSGECLQVRHAHRGTVHSLRTSPDGNILASCGADGAIMLWGARRGEYLQTLRQDRPYERLNIAGIKGLSETQKETLRALGAIEKVTPPF
jgi:WD40 repeat protein